MSLAALAAYSDSDDSGEEEREQETEEGRAQAANPALQSKEEVRKLVNVVGRRGKSSSVKIGLPVVRGGEDLSDDEELSTVPKRPKGKGGLAALLPEPKRSSSSKGLLVSKPISATKLVPDSLRRKKRAPPPQQRKAAGKAKKCEGGGSESEESGDEEAPFFSHLESSEALSDSYKTAASSSMAEPLSPAKLPSLQPPSTIPPPLLTTNPILPPSLDTTPAPGLTQESHDSPSGYHDNSSTGYSQLYHTQYSYNQYSVMAPSVEPVAGEPGQKVVPPLDQASATAPDTSNTADTSSSVDDVMLNDAAFRRLAGGGRKGRRKKEEEISLEQMVDIHERDNLMKDKYFSEEHSYTSGTVPAHLAFDHTQKRKHQIHWLANQAKSRELELKNFWSQAAHSRKQTQSKYGF